MRGFLRVLVCAAVPLALAGAPLHAKPHFKTFSLGGPTFPASINNNGAITGYVQYADQGFVRQPDGTSVQFGISEPYAHGVTPARINDNGDVTGYYSVTGGVDRGFIRKADGTIQTFDIPIDNNGVHSLVINSAGTVFGNFWRSKTRWYGFARQPDGTATKLECNSAMIYLAGANDSGQVAGSNDGGGLVLNPDGSCTQFNAGGPTAINAEGSVAGVVNSYPFTTNFLRTPDGAVTTYTAPAQYFNARPVGINANRVIAGWFQIGWYGPSRGYIRQPDGRMTIFSAGGMPIGDTGPKSTIPAAINDAGVIVGTVYGAQPNSPATGFIRYP